MQNEKRKRKKNKEKKENYITHKKKRSSKQKIKPSKNNLCYSCPLQRLLNDLKLRELFLI